MVSGLTLSERQLALVILGLLALRGLALDMIGVEAARRLGFQKSGEHA